MNKKRLLLTSVAIFRNVSVGCTIAIVKALRPVIVLQREYVCVQGQRGDEMYFISRGVVQETKFLPLEDGSSKAALRRQSSHASLVGSFRPSPRQAALMLDLRRVSADLLGGLGARRRASVRPIDGPQILEMPIRQMGKGEHFGVKALVEKDGLHGTNQLALVHCELQVLKRRRFELMVEEFPEFREQLVASLKEEVAVPATVPAAVGVPSPGESSQQKNERLSRWLDEGSPVAATPSSGEAPAATTRSRPPTLLAALSLRCSTRGCSSASFASYPLSSRLSSGRFRGSRAANLPGSSTRRMNAMSSKDLDPSKAEGERVFRNAANYAASASTGVRKTRSCKVLFTGSATRKSSSDANKLGGPPAPFRPAFHRGQSSCESVGSS
jgi:CRP-like cAMP-binding protein